MRVQGAHRAPPAGRLDGAGEHAPRLHDRVDAAGIVALGAEGRAVVEVRAAVPVAVPALALDRQPQRGGVTPPALGARPLAPGPRPRGPVGPDPRGGPGPP